MRELGGKVAVVTGAASGIGKSLATRFAAEGMKVVLADVEEGPLASTAAELEAAGRAVLAVPTDVTSGGAVASLRTRAIARFGAVHVVCNNAGVGGAAGPLWTLTEADWAWTLGVNLWGVVHGIRAFVPGMIAQGEGHVVNTASIAGLISPALLGPYVATKHAVVALSSRKVLARDLERGGSPGLGERAVPRLRPHPHRREPAQLARPTSPTPAGRGSARPRGPRRRAWCAAWWTAARHPTRSPSAWSRPSASGASTCSRTPSWPSRSSAAWRTSSRATTPRLPSPPDGAAGGAGPLG